MARNKAPSLALEPAQEQAALLMLQRFLDERFELQLGTFEVQEILDQITRELAPHYYLSLIHISSNRIPWRRSAGGQRAAASR